MKACKKLGKRTLRWSSLFGSSLAASIKLASETGFRKGELFASKEESHFLQWDAISMKLQGVWIPAIPPRQRRCGHLCSLTIVLQSPRPIVKLANPAQFGVPSLAIASFSQLAGVQLEESVT